MLFYVEQCVCFIVSNNSGCYTVSSNLFLLCRTIVYFFLSNNSFLFCQTVQVVSLCRTICFFHVEQLRCFTVSNNLFEYNEQYVCFTVSNNLFLFCRTLVYFTLSNKFKNDVYDSRLTICKVQRSKGRKLFVVDA